MAANFLLKRRIGQIKEKDEKEFFFTEFTIKFTECRIHVVLIKFKKPVNQTIQPELDYVILPEMNRCVFKCFPSTDRSTFNAADNSS